MSISNLSISWRTPLICDDVPKPRIFCTASEGIAIAVANRARSMITSRQRQAAQRAAKGRTYTYEPVKVLKDCFWMDIADQVTDSGNSAQRWDIIISVVDGDVFDMLNELDDNDLKAAYGKAISQMSRGDTAEWDLQNRNRNFHFKVNYNKFHGAYYKG